MHRHRPKRSEDHGYTSAITRENGTQNPAAHGAIRRIDTCDCGAVRHTNINGGHRESSGWMSEDDS